MARFPALLPTGRLLAGLAWSRASTKVLASGARPASEYSSNVPGPRLAWRKAILRLSSSSQEHAVGRNEPVVAVAASILTAADQRPADVASRR